LVGYIFSPQQQQKINTATTKKSPTQQKQQPKKINKNQQKINKSPKSGEVSPAGTTKNHRSGEISLDPVRSHLIWNHQKLVTTICAAA
jgi:hypothetical protein